MIDSDPKISIIIPTKNRCHLIGETLNSILVQTYKSWECIVVDDCSTDYTEELLEFYCEKDSRFRFHSRPPTRLYGANACRNYGLEMSRGSFINWFDSDDLMSPKNLEIKLRALTSDLDFVIGNSLNFDKHGNIHRPFKLNYDMPITPDNFIGGKIGWITDDVLIRKSAIKIQFNEKLKSGQEYNFFSRLLYITTRAKYVKEDLVKRRIHSESIQEKLTSETASIKASKLFINELLLFDDLRTVSSITMKKRSIRRLVRFSYDFSVKYRIKKQQLQVLKLLITYSFYIPFLKYFFWTMSNFSTGRGYIFIREIDLD